MAGRWFPRKLRFGLQMKAIVILVAIVAAVVCAGGWFYFNAAQEFLRSADLQKALHMGEALAVSAEPDLRDRRVVPLHELANEQVGRDGVVYVAILDDQGQVVASAGPSDEAGRWGKLLELPLTTASTARGGEDRVLVARPVHARGALFWSDRLAGAVRMVVDTSGTRGRLAVVRTRMNLIGAGVILCAIPLGYVLVWRMMVRPMHQLIGVTRRLGEGDFAARAKLDSGDEIGTLARSFDTMADEVVDMRDELIRANDQLEQKVADRTADLQVANGRLRDEMVEKEDFLRAVSHDLNAPLRNIAGMATMIMAKWRDAMPEEAVARLQRIQTNVDAETALIGELLELSRVKTRPQRRQVVDVGELLAELAGTFEFELKANNIDIEIAPAMPSLWVEKNRIRQLFQNLIDNAIKYMDKPHGRIELGYERVGTFHEFRVSDNGPGIPADQWEKIFRVFRRVPGAAATKIQGKGVGLALVKGIVSTYDGKAWVWSQVGQGSTFHVALGVKNTRPPAKACDEQVQSHEGTNRDRQPVA